MQKYKYTRQDWRSALFVTFIILVIGASVLTKGVPDWGDDFAAYISEGIAIAEGDFHEQAVRNYVMHPSPLASEAGPEGLVYVWGYPLMLSGIYKLVGFDRVGYSSVIWYKIPSLLGLALLGGVLVLFYRKRFSLTVSIVLAMLMCFSDNVFRSLNHLYSDLTFLFFSMVTLLLAEEFGEKMTEKKIEKKTKKKTEKKIEKKTEIWLGVIYGVVLWFTHEIRLNGIAVCAAALLGHMIILIRNREKVSRNSLTRQVIPYVVFAILTFTSEHLWLAPATSNMSDMGRATAEQAIENIYAYKDMIIHFLASLPGFHMFGLGYILFAAIIIGIVFKGITDHLHLTLLTIGTLIVDVLLPYQQGLRYIYNILPLLLMFSAYGVQLACKFASGRIKGVTGIPEIKQKETLKAVSLLISAYILIIPAANHLMNGINNLSHWGRVNNDDVYAPQAVDMYNYIQNTVPEDKLIAFGKPRALYLNTNRMAIRTGYNGHRIADADYYLEYHTAHLGFTREQEEAYRTPKEPVYENELFRLYKMIKD